MNQSITLIPSSPYNTLYSDKLLITRNELNFIKILRQNNLEVNIRSDDGEKAYYVVEKGFKEFIEHPLRLFLISIPLSVIVNIASNHLDARIFSNLGKKAELVIQKQENGTIISYSQEGKELSQEQLETIFNKSKELFFVENYKNVKPSSPNPDECPHPIYLEHTNKIVGWGNAYQGKQGLMLKNGLITDDETQKLIDEGVLKGLSITGVVKQSECSVCESEYFDCPHVSGEVYNGIKCINNIIEIELVNINLVKEPVNPHALLNLITKQ